MKKTLRLVGVAAMVLLLAASCKKEEKNNGETRKVTFTAGIEQGGGAKTGLTPNGQVSHAFNQVWTEGDNIRINGHNFVLETGKETASGTFTGEVALSDQGPYYAFYPAPVETQQRGDQDFSKVTFGLPSTQDYIEKSYQTNLAPMAVKSDNQQLTFTNLCGLLELSLKGDGITVTSLKLSCDKPICGQTAEYTIGGDAALAMPAEAGKIITMNCVTTAYSNGVALNGTTPTSFIFVLPPVENGHFSLVVNYKKGDVNVFVETIDLTNMNISINASQVSYNNTAYEIGTVTTKGINESGASVGATTATILYTVDNMAGYRMSESGVCYGVNENPDLTNQQTGSSSASSYTASLIGLSPNTHYYARAYAKYSPASKDGSDVVVYGNQIDFTTQSIGGTVTTGNVISFTATGASLGYSVEPNAYSQATQHGVCYGTSQNPVYTGSHVSGTDPSPYTVSVSSLTPNTTYYYRAYAIFAVASKDEPEVVYGEEKSFTTQSIGGTVTTDNVSSITATGASVAYTVTPNDYSQATQHGVCYSTSQNPTISGTHTEATGTNYTASLTSLNASTTYYVRAYAVFGPASKDGNSVTVYGEQISFQTSSGSSAPDGFVDFGTHVGGIGGTEPLYWAKCNVGATDANPYGGVYMWGHVSDCSNLCCEWQINDNNTDYRFVITPTDGNNLTKYCYNKTDGYDQYTDNLTQLENVDDAAWTENNLNRMATSAEWEELISLTYMETTDDYNGLHGMIVYKAKNEADRGKKDTQTVATYTRQDTHIFLPGGYRKTNSSSWDRTPPTYPVYYWTKSLNMVNPRKARVFDSGSIYSDAASWGGRIYGLRVRPVREQNP